jgi:hypothetical protein
LGYRHFFSVAALQSHIATKHTTLLRTIDALPIANHQKLQAYSIAVRWQFTWDLSICDLATTFTDSLDRSASNYLRRWSGLAKMGSRDIFFLNRKHFGLDIPSIRTLHTRSRATYWTHVQASRDPAIQQRLAIAKNFNIHQWQPAFERRKQTAAEKTAKQQAAAVAAATAAADEQSRLDRLKSLEWEGSVIRHMARTHLAWNAAAYSLPPSLLRFGINATLSTLPSLNNLNRWYNTNNQKCRLCDRNETIIHVLNGCQLALQSGRYKWRHDSILTLLANFIQQHLDTEWTLLVDLPNHANAYSLIPPSLCTSVRRPDILVVNHSTKAAFFCELTVPAEENLAEAHAYKVDKYAKEQQDTAANGWTVAVVAFEIGSRGFHNGSLRYLLKQLRPAFSPPPTRLDRRKLLSTCSRTALNCSYLIWLTRRHPTFTYPQL